MSDYVTWNTCRVCASSDLTPLFSLGEQYVSDFVEPGKEKNGHLCPIELDLCNNCTLVQQRHTAPQDFLYTRKYWYRSGVTQTMRDALRNITEEIEQEVELSFGDVVLDIGSNDGTLLRSYADNPIIRVGVEPATNLAEQGQEGVDYFINDFWSYESYALLGLGKAKVITAIGMFYDLEDPNKFIGDVAKALHANGIFVCQLMCLKQTLDLADVGNLAHEHLEFYSIRSLTELFYRHGLEIQDIEENEINGGSYRIIATHKENSYYQNINAISKVYDKERNLSNPDSYVPIISQIEENRVRTNRFVRSAVANGKRVWVYGASTKGNVLLQYYGLGKTLIEGAAERSPEKWGKVTIGTGIPIRSEAEAREANPDYFLVLPYAFLDEFVERERLWRDGGGKFIVPLPELRIV
ncbi:class I SAM-dependent methyltransferase [bacterium]|nr:class I SAM-dependent methyltransferase [bacterium]